MDKVNNHANKGCAKMPPKRRHVRTSKRSAQNNKYKHHIINVLK